MKLGIRRDGEVELVDGLVALEEPSHHPARRGGPARARETVLLVRFEQVDPLAVAEAAVDQLGLAERIPAALDVEEVAGPDRQEGRLGGAQRHVIGVVHPRGDLAGDVLFGVLRPRSWP